MNRVVLAAVLALALLAVAVPAVETGGRERTERVVGADLRELATTARALADGEAAVPPGEVGAVRYVTVSVPPASRTAGGTVSVSVGTLPGRSPGGTGGESPTANVSNPPDGPRTDVLVLHVAGREPVVFRTGVDLRVGSALAPDDRGLVLRSAGDHRLRLALVEGDGGPVVVVERP